jgi:hypothetical protein
MISTMNQYICKTCTKTYKHKYNYDRHIACCKFFQKSIQEYEDEMDSVEIIPDMQSMFKLVQELACKVNRIEKENNQLKQKLSKRNKINVLDWLNKLPIDKIPNKSFTDWIKDVVLTNVYLHLDNVYTNDLITGIMSTWHFSIDESNENIPLKAFDNRINIFYKYDIDPNGKNCWMILTNEEMDNQLKKICKQFLIDFKNHWYDKHEDKINTDEKWTNMYVKYHQRILGGSRITTEVICQRVRQQLYKSIKQGVSHAIEIDYT